MHHAKTKVEMTCNKHEDQTLDVYHYQIKILVFQLGGKGYSNLMQGERLEYERCFIQKPILRPEYRILLEH